MTIIFTDRGSVDTETLTHAYGFDGSGNLITDTATDGVETWVQSFTYTNGQLSGASKWVKQ